MSLFDDCLSYLSYIVVTRATMLLTAAQRASYVTQLMFVYSLLTKLAVSLLLCTKDIETPQIRKRRLNVLRLW